MLCIIPPLSPPPTWPPATTSTSPDLIKIGRLSDQREALIKTIPIMKWHKAAKNGGGLQESNQRCTIIQENSACSAYPDAGRESTAIHKQRTERTGPPTGRFREQNLVQQVSKTHQLHNSSCDTKSLHYTEQPIYIKLLHTPTR